MPDVSLSRLLTLTCVVVLAHWLPALPAGLHEPLSSGVRRAHAQQEKDRSGAAKHERPSPMYLAAMEEVRRDGGLDEHVGKPWDDLMARGDEAFAGSRFVSARHWYMAAAHKSRLVDPDGAPFVMAARRASALFIDAGARRCCEETEHVRPCRIPAIEGQVP